MGKRPSAGLPPRRGGVRQRLRAAGVEHDVPDCGPSKLIELLVSSVVWGELSAPFAQKIAAAAVEDGLCHPSVKQLSRMGTSGEYPGKIFGQLMAQLPRLPLLEAVRTLTVPAKVTLRSSTVVKPVGLALPSSFRFCIGVACSSQGHIVI